METDEEENARDSRVYPNRICPLTSKKESRKHARKIKLYRRLTVFAVVAAIILGGMTHMYFKQKQDTGSEGT